LVLPQLLQIKVGILFKNQKHYRFFKRHNSLFTQSTENSTPHNICKLTASLHNPRFILYSMKCTSVVHKSWYTTKGTGCELSG
jgi:hypothetical protein